MTLRLQRLQRAACSSLRLCTCYRLAVAPPKKSPDAMQPSSSSRPKPTTSQRSSSRYHMCSQKSLLYHRSMHTSPGLVTDICFRKAFLLSKHVVCRYPRQCGITSRIQARPLAHGDGVFNERRTCAEGEIKKEKRENAIVHRTLASYNLLRNQAGLIITTDPRQRSVLYRGRLLQTSTSEAITRRGSATTTGAIH